jgi:hypothetical protein
MSQLSTPLCWCASLIALAMFAPASVYATPLGIAPLRACANDECVDLSEFLVNPDGGDQTTFDATVTIGGSTIRLFGTYDVDPFISFGATSTNLTAEQTTFSFLFGTPIDPGFYNTATSTGSVSVTNGASGTSTVATSAVYPTFISGYGTLGLVPTNLGVDLGTTPCVATGTSFTVTMTCSQGNASNTFAPTFFDNLEALLTYTQNDVGSVASWSGSVTLTLEPVSTVPEPTSLLFVTTGTVGMLTRIRRRHRRIQ